MRKWTATVLLATLLAALPAGCTGRPTASDQPSRTPSMADTPSPGPSTPEPTAGATSAPGTTPPTGGSTPTAPGAATSPPDDRGGDLVRGRRTLTGTVERDGSCVFLVVAGKRWNLSGAPTERLTGGQQITVTGTLAAVQTGCTADQALLVTRVQPT
jgi:hypothetical protein